MNQSDDEGFTLLEVLMSMTILAIVVAAVVSALTVFLKTGADTSKRDDHSAGVAVVTSYLDRDLASADSVVTSGTTCSGVSNKLVLSWTQWTSSPASPVPTATGGTWSAAYALVSYTNTSIAGSPTRYRLNRYYCAPGVGPVLSTLLKNLNAADITASVNLGDPACSAGRVSVSVSRYIGDTGSDDIVSGCMKGRLS